MQSEVIPLIFIGFIVLAIVLRLVAGSFDGDRVKGYIEETLGGELIDQSWDPLGPGWFGEKDSRIYAIVYKDRSGVLHRAHVKTSMMSGVYLTNDQVVDAPKTMKYSRRSELADLDVEKQQLEERLREIEAMKREEA